MTLAASTLDDLAAMPARLAAAFARVPRTHWTWTPSSWDGIPGERFSPLGQLCHVRDIEIDGYHVRIQRMLTEDHPDLVSLDSYALASGRDYDTADPETALATFRTARTETLRLLADLTPAQLERRGTFGEYGAITLRSLVHYLTSHDYQHLACLEWLIGRAYGG